MIDHNDSQKTWIAIAFLAAVFLLFLICWVTCHDAHAYLGEFAPGDTASARAYWPIAVTDSVGMVNIDPTAMTIYCAMNGTVYDSTGKSGTSIRWFKGAANSKFPGAAYATFNPSSSTTTYGHGTCFAKVTVQGCVVSVSNTWTVDSLHTPLTAASGWTTITQADCDTVKIAGVVQADVTVIVTLNSNRTTPLYMDRTDANGCYTVYVPTGATYAVRPMKQGAWLAAWCTVAK